MIVVGTRPEAIKLMPLIRALQRQSWSSLRVVTTGQQNELLDDTLRELNITPDIRIPHESSSRQLSHFLGDILRSLDVQIETWNPDIVMAQGDTTTTLAAAMCAFYRTVAFIHIEAGLRSANIQSPFPEEYNRRAIALATNLHCAPTTTARDNLLAEGIPHGKIMVSGNTVIDSLLVTAAEETVLPGDFPSEPRVILVTLHRRENFGNKMRGALVALRDFIDKRPDVAIFFSLHPNPASRIEVEAQLGGHPRINLTEPLSYRQLVSVMKACWCVVTDSGGLQEEAPALGKPVLILRDTTERPEVVEAGVAQLVGTNRAAVYMALDQLYQDQIVYARMSKGAMPYGDGTAADRIVSEIQKRWDQYESPSQPVKGPRWPI